MDICGSLSAFTLVELPCFRPHEERDIRAGVFGVDTSSPNAKVNSTPGTVFAPRMPRAILARSLPRVEDVYDLQSRPRAFLPLVRCILWGGTWN